MEFTTKPKNWQFSYSTEYENRPLKDGGFITWDNQEIVAVSKPNITAKEAVEFYIPSTKEVNREIDNAEHVEQAAKLLSWLFGGSTSTPGLGYWISN